VYNAQFVVDLQAVYIWPTGNYPDQHFLEFVSETNKKYEYIWPYRI